MPFNYGTAGSIRDPRMAYAPRQVDGVSAYWQANPGRMVDTQTGMPLAERLAMIRGQQPAPQNYVYGDSYGGIQAQEQAIQQAAFNRALALEQLRRQDQARMDSRNDRSAMFSQQQQLRRDQMLQNARNAQAQQLARLADLDIARGREAGLNQRSANSIQGAMDRARLKLEADGSGEKSDMYGDAFASEVSDVLGLQSQLENQLEQDDAEDSELNRLISVALSHGAIKYDKDSGVYSQGPNATNSRELLAKANEFSRTGGKAAATAEALRRENNRARSIFSAMRTKGYYPELQKGVIVQGDREWDIEIPGPVVRQVAPIQPQIPIPQPPPKALIPPTTRVLPKIRGGSWQSR